MKVCVRRINVLSRWELRRFLEMGGLKEIVSSFFGAAVVGCASGVLGDYDLVSLLIAVTPVAGGMMALQSFVKEREGGILPALLSSPATAGELVLGKTIGFFVIGLILYWAAVFGALIGAELGMSVRETPVAAGWGRTSLLTLAVAMTPAMLAIVAATVAICWHARTLRDALFWAIASAGLAAGAAIPLMAIGRVLGTGAMLLSACVLGLLTIGVVLYHAGRLAPEPVLYRWAKKQSRKGRLIRTGLSRARD